MSLSILPLTPTPNILWMLVATFSSLAAGSLVRWAAVRRADDEIRSKRLASLRTWWILTILLAAAVLLGRGGVCLLLATASMLAFREYARLVATRFTDRWGIGLVYLVIALNYALILFDWRSSFLVFTPLVLSWLLAAVQVIQGETKNYVRSTAGLAWGAMVLVYGLAHAALLTTLPAAANPAAGPVGWFLYLVVLTETNDISQALIGRRFEAHKRHRITPRVSPNKTWEGFLGGLLITLLLAAALSPLLTSLHKLPVRLGRDVQLQVPFFWPVAAGLLIAISGFFGDINMSAVKRDAGVKDSSELLPGMGGMVDRIDSLTFSAPLFYHLVSWIT